MRPLLLKGHERPLTRVKFNREGDLVFTVAMDKSPTVWRASNGERLGTYRGHNGAVRDVDISYHTERIVTGSADNTACLWVAETGVALHSWEHASPVRCTSFAPGDAHIAVATAKLMGQDSNVFIYKHDMDAKEQDPTPVLTLEGHSGTIARVLWYPTKQYILTAAEDQTIRKWDVETGTEIGCIENAHARDIKDCQFSVDSQAFITASKDCTAKLWDFHNMRQLKVYTADNPVNSAAISPRFPHVLLGGGQEASQVTTTSDRAGKFEGKIYHMVYEEELGRVKGHFGPINTVSFSPDGTKYVSGGEDGFVRMHDFDPDYFEREDGWSL
jgi:translation initiation factor 3 subunit I